MKKRFLLFSLATLAGLTLAKAVNAVCPVCVVAVGAGVGLCRWFGVDDTISGLWIGAMIVATIVWCIRWMRSVIKKFKFDQVLISALFYFLVIYPLYYFNIMGHPLNKILGIDKLLFGIISGSAIFLFGSWLNLYLKQKNQGNVYFYYQKIIIPVILLLISSFVFYFIIKCY